MSKYSNDTLTDMADSSENFIKKVDGQWMVATEFEWFDSKEDAMEALAALDGYESVKDFKKQEKAGFADATSWRSRQVS